MASDPNIKQGGEKPESTVHIEAVTFDVIQARIKKQVRKTVAVSIIGVLVPLLVTSITGLAQLFSKQDEFRISVEKKYTEFTQQQSKDILEFKAALDKAYAVFNGEVRNNFTALSGRIDKVDSQILDIKDSLKRIEARLDRIKVASVPSSTEPSSSIQIVQEN